MILGKILLNMNCVVRTLLTLLTAGTSWIKEVCWSITIISIQIRIPCSKPDGINLDPPTQSRAVLAEPEIPQAGRDLEPSALMQVDPGVAADTPASPTGGQAGAHSDAIVDEPLHYVP